MCFYKVNELTEAKNVLDVCSIIDIPNGAVMTAYLKGILFYQLQQYQVNAILCKRQLSTYHERALHTRHTLRINRTFIGLYLPFVIGITKPLSTCQ
jgi:hypothetical protein